MFSHRHPICFLAWSTDPTQCPVGTDIFCCDLALYLLHCVIRENIFCLTESQSPLSWTTQSSWAFDTQCFLFWGIYMAQYSFLNVPLSYHFQVHTVTDMRMCRVCVISRPGWIIHLEVYCFRNMSSIKNPWA